MWNFGKNPINDANWMITVQNRYNMRNSPIQHNGGTMHAPTAISSYNYTTTPNYYNLSVPGYIYQGIDNDLWKYKNKKSIDRLRILLSLYK